MLDIVYLDDASADKNLLGGKGAALARLSQSGIPVPPGFVISTQAYKSSKNGISKELQDKILRAYDKLSAEYVAVRSSAVAEDGNAASWAGQLESYLFIERINLNDAVNNCWQSLNSDRVKAYAANQPDNTNQTMAVVVQQMVNARKAGVIFTANPITTNPNEIIIEAVWGLGETLVQGLATPENWVIEKNNQKVLNHTKHHQLEKVIHQAGSLVTVPLSQSERNGSILSDTDIKRLIKYATAIEDLYGQPQDIEWVICDGQIYIVQARPITTLLK